MQVAVVGHLRVEHAHHGRIHLRRGLLVLLFLHFVQTSLHVLRRHRDLEVRVGRVHRGQRRVRPRVHDRLNRGLRHLVPHVVVAVVVPEQPVGGVRGHGGRDRGRRHRGGNGVLDERGGGGRQVVHLVVPKVQVVRRGRRRRRRGRRRRQRGSRVVPAVVHVLGNRKVVRSHRGRHLQLKSVRARVVVLHRLHVRRRVHRVVAHLVRRHVAVGAQTAQLRVHQLATVLLRPLLVRGRELAGAGARLAGEASPSLRADLLRRIRTSISSGSAAGKQLPRSVVEVGHRSHALGRRVVEGVVRRDVLRVREVHVDVRGRVVLRDRVVGRDPPGFARRRLHARVPLAEAFERLLAVPRHRHAGTVVPVGHLQLGLAGDRHAAAGRLARRQRDAAGQAADGRGRELPLLLVRDRRVKQHAPLVPQFTHVHGVVQLPPLHLRRGQLAPQRAALRRAVLVLQQLPEAARDPHLVARVVVRHRHALLLARDGGLLLHLAVPRRERVLQSVVRNRVPGAAFVLAHRRPLLFAPLVRPRAVVARRRGDAAAAVPRVALHTVVDHVLPRDARLARHQRGRVRPPLVPHVVHARLDRARLLVRRPRLHLVCVWPLPGRRPRGGRLRRARLHRGDAGLCVRDHARIRLVVAQLLVRASHVHHLPGGRFEVADVVVQLLAFVLALLAHALGRVRARLGERRPRLHERLVHALDGLPHLPKFLVRHASSHQRSRVRARALPGVHVDVAAVRIGE
mmetsp:Transcript_25339/g.63790  ORF Transcript_25339/g.63790 Transcript_25339/m.63790 type:complete len:739 (-) Transcript_25339:1751-3967(-)